MGKKFFFVLPAIINDTHIGSGKFSQGPSAPFFPNLPQSHTAYEVMAFPGPL